MIYAVPADNETSESLLPELNRRIAAEFIPLFKIHEVVLIDALPRTVSNRVMRRELCDRYLRSRQAND